MRQRVVPVLFIFFFVCLFFSHAYYDGNMRAEIDTLREEIKAKRDAGLLEEARALQDELRDKVSRRHGGYDPLSTDYDAMVQDRIKRHQEERRQAHKARYSSSRSRSRGSRGSSTSSSSSSKFTDSRSLHQMDQSNRKADILRNKIQRGASLFLPSEIDDYNKRVADYLAAEEKVAESLQATADDYNKARSMRDKESRLKHIEGAKSRKQKRHEDEYGLREISRQKFFSLNDELDARLNKNEL